MKKLVVLLMAVILMAGCATWDKRVARKEARIDADKSLYELYGSQAIALANKQEPKPIIGVLVNDRNRDVVFELHGLMSYSFTVPACDEDPKKCQRKEPVLSGRYFMKVREIESHQPFYCGWVFIDPVPNNANLEGEPTGFVLRAY
ncbi:MAG: hypothetical protein V1692_02925 [bacterium]